MTRSKFIRLSGWSLILGAVTFFLFILSTSGNENRPLGQLFLNIGYQMSIWGTPILLGIGLLGLRTRYGNEVDGFARNILLVGAVLGLVVNIAGPLIVGIFGGSNANWSWIVPFTGNAVILACLSIFGISALSEKPFPRWNFLPLIAGIWYPLVIVAVYVFEAIGLSQDQVALVAIPAILFQCGLLVVLGYMLQSGLPQEEPAAA